MTTLEEAVARRDAPRPSRDARRADVRLRTRRPCDRCRRALRRGPAGDRASCPGGAAHRVRAASALHRVSASGFPAGRRPGSGAVGPERNHELHPRRSRPRVQRHARANVSRRGGLSSATDHRPHRAPRRLAACERSAVADQDRRRGRRATRDARGASRRSGATAQPSSSSTGSAPRNGTATVPRTFTTCFAASWTCGSSTWTVRVRTLASGSSTRSLRRSGTSSLCQDELAGQAHRRQHVRDLSAQGRRTAAHLQPLPAPGRPVPGRRDRAGRGRRARGRP